jgi:hypothetical protein
VLLGRNPNSVNPVYDGEGHEEGVEGPEEGKGEVKEKEQKKSEGEENKREAEEGGEGAQEFDPTWVSWDGHGDAVLEWSYEDRDLRASGCTSSEWN